jgi:hypothetical protein
MSLTGDILRSYRAPRRVLSHHLAAGKREDRALLYLMVACVLLFVAQWPALARSAQADPSVPFEARMGGALIGVLFVLPLLSYGLAFLIWLGLRPFGSLSLYGARLALFWAMLAISPLVLAQSALASVLGSSSAAVQAFGYGVLAAFLVILIAGLRAALEAGRAAA